MIIKPFEESLILSGLRTLVRRLDTRDIRYPKILLELQKVEAGDAGEQFLMKQLENLAYSMNFKVLHNITISKPVPIQLDIVIITTTDILILECKNIRGNIHLKSRPRQMIRTQETGEKNIFYHPEIQLEEYIFGLREFFVSHQITVNVNGIIVFPFNNANITYEEGKFPVLVMREISHFLRQYLLENQQKPSIPSDRVAQLLLQYNQLFNPFPLCNYYKIEPHIIKKGIYCCICEQVKMQRIKKNWYCPKCQKFDSLAHVRALNEYRMLIDDCITTKAAQNFLEVSDRHLAKRFVQKNCVRKSGSNRKTVYHFSK